MSVVYGRCPTCRRRWTDEDIREAATAASATAASVTEVVAPEVTDAMVKAADEALQDRGVCSHDVSPVDIRVAIAAALKAQGDKL